MTQYTALETAPVTEIYRSRPNYKVINGKGKGIAYIFFSGNGLYFPNTEESFQKTVIEGDRFEWENIAKSLTGTAEKIIFVRDVYKRWYLSGINASLTDPDAVTELLRGICNGLSVVITAGNSAGAYMAIYAGIRLGATRVYAFNPQISLHLVNPDDQTAVVRLKNTEKQKYFDIAPTVFGSDVPVYLFYAAKNRDDVRHASLIREAKNVRFFAFDEKIHGKTVLSVNYVPLLKRGDSLDRLCRKLNGKIVSARTFLFASTGLCGGWLYVKSLILRGIGKLRKR